MVSRDTMPGVGARIGGIVARHPRLVVAVAATIVLLALQDGAVAVEELTTGTTAEGAVDPGPQPD
jgi:hypothetical protein